MIDTRATVAMLAVIACGALATASLAAPAGRASAESASVTRYSKKPIISCLRGKRVVVSVGTPANRRLRALHDLAQRSSWQAKQGKSVVGIAIGRSAADAALVVELLRVPNDRYRIERRENVVLLFAPASAKLARVVRGCLA
jgi:hypothetical protein